MHYFIDLFFFLRATNSTPASAASIRLSGDLDSIDSRGDPLVDAEDRSEEGALPADTDMLAS